MTETNGRRLSDPVYGPAVITPPVLLELTGSLPCVDEQVQRTGFVDPHADTAAVIVAGGSGERFGATGGKQLYSILGRPLLTWSVRAFDSTPGIGHIVIVCPEERVDEYIEHAITPFNFVTPISIACSGLLRQESAMNGVEAVPERFPYIAIHDGARPLVTPATITHAINVLKGNFDADGVIVGHPAIDTLKVIDGDTIVGTPDRSMFWIAQTPQIFHRDICRAAYSTAMAEGFVGTDDSSLVERVGGHVVLVDCPRDNIKVTVPEDLGPVKAALEQRFLTGSSYLDEEHGTEL